MKVHFTDEVWDKYRHWAGSDPEILERVNALIVDCQGNPSKGLEKPEPLNGDLAGWWSRSVSGGHRRVYRIAGKAGSDQRIEIAARQYHYGSG